jgi:6-phosphogluconolactonase
MKRPALLFILTFVLAAPASAGEYFVYAGSYTGHNSTSKGIYAWRFDSGSSATTPIGLVAQTPNPAYVCTMANGRYLYAGNWQDNGAKEGDPGVSAYRIDGKTGKLTFINKASSGGEDTNQVVCDPSGKVVIAVNYGAHKQGQHTAGIAALAIGRDGRASEPFYIDLHDGTPLSPRQKTGAHTHGLVFSKDGHYAFVAELGLDRVYTYSFDAAKAHMAPFDPPYVNVAAGSGPRRLQLNPNGKFLYVNHETDSKVSVFRVDGGNLKEIQQISTLPAGFAGRNSTAEIAIDKAGRYLYVSNRGHDSIAVYRVDPASGILTALEWVPSGGKTPRNIMFDATGEYLFAANQGSGNIVIFKQNPQTGHLTPAGQDLKMDQPGSLAFAKARN